jgi:hypothetical protein
MLDAFEEKRTRARKLRLGWNGVSRHVWVANGLPAAAGNVERSASCACWSA